MFFTGTAIDSVETNLHLIQWFFISIQCFPSSVIAGFQWSITHLPSNRRLTIQALAWAEMQKSACSWTEHCDDAVRYLLSLTHRCWPCEAGLDARGRIHTLFWAWGGSIWVDAMGWHWPTARHPPKLLTHSPLQTARKTENLLKGSWVERRTGKDPPPNTITDKTGST